MSKRINHLSRPSHGFTLVELLVVMSIISLLIALLLPALGKTRESTRKIQCATNLRGLGTMLFSYLADNNNLVPCIGLGGSQGMWPVNQITNRYEFFRMLTQWGNIPFPNLPVSGFYSSLGGIPPKMEALICPSAPVTTGGWNSQNDFTMFVSRYTWFANNFATSTGAGQTQLDANSSDRAFTKLSLDNLEFAQSQTKNPWILAMDRINASDNPNNIFGTGYGTGLVFATGYGQGQYQFKTNHWSDATNDSAKNYDGANVVRLDGSVLWYGWQDGNGWYDPANLNHARPQNTTVFTGSASASWETLSSGDASTLNIGVNTANISMSNLSTATYLPSYNLLKKKLNCH